MLGAKDWRDTFCGRQGELSQLRGLYSEVATGNGPRLAVILGDRGMGKTRLVQEFYRSLSIHCDPQNYWPDASLFDGNNIRVAPEMSDADVAAHYASFRRDERPMPYLWWGFRLSNVAGRNALRSGLAAHRQTLEPHLGPVFFARRLASAKERLRATGISVGTAAGKKLLAEFVKQIPGIGLAASAVDILLDFSDKGASAIHTLKDQSRIAKEWREGDVVRTERARVDDLLSQTLNDLSELLAPAPELTPLPCIVFCDDAQFARTGGDEAALRLISELWERAHLASWPLLLVLTHWEFEWCRDEGLAKTETCASMFARSARSDQFGRLVQLSKEPALRALVFAGLPGLPDDDVAFLLERADGNPQVLIELIELVRRAPAWQLASDGRLPKHAREELENRPTELAALIVERLESQSTPEPVRQAVALSAVQGVEFVCGLTTKAAAELRLGNVSQALLEAEHSHRLVSGVGGGVATFVQNAYCDAAKALLSGHVGERRVVEQVLLSEVIAVVDDGDRWSGLSTSLQSASLGVLVGLAEHHDDRSVRRYAGRALVRLIACRLDAVAGADYATASELAQRLEAGFDGRWEVQDFAPEELENAVKAIATWLGPARTANMSRLCLARNRALASESATPERRLGLCRSLRLVGEAAQALGEWAAADLNYKECMAIARDVAEQSGSLEARRDVFRSLILLGDLALAQSNLHSAGTCFGEALDLGRELTREAGSPELKRGVAVALIRVAEVAWSNGDLASAERRYVECVVICRELAVQSRGDDSMRDVAVSLNRVGSIAIAKCNWEAANEFFGESLSICRGLADRLGTPQARSDLEVPLQNLAAVARALGDLDKAEALYHENLAIARGLAAQLGTPTSRRSFSLALAYMAQIAEARGDPAGADAMYRECLSSFRSLAAHLGTIEARRDVAVTVSSMANMAKARADCAAAELLHFEALAIYREMAAELGTARSQHDVMQSLIDCGAVARVQGNRVAAEMLHLEALSLGREVAAKLGTLTAKRDLGIVLWQLAADNRAGGESEVASNFLQEALLILKSVADSQNTPQSRDELNALRQYIEGH